MLIKFKKENSCIIFQSDLLSSAKDPDGKELFNNIKSINTVEFKNQSWLVILLPETATLNSPALSSLCRIASYISEYGLSLSLIVQEGPLNVILKNNMKDILKPFLSVEEFYVNNKIDFNKEQKVNEFVATLKESAEMSFKVLLEVQSVECRVTVLRDPFNAPAIQVGAMAGILSTYFNGNIVMGFSNDVFRKAMGRFLQMEVTGEISNEIKDGAAELLNVVIGQTKIKLNEKSYNIKQVIPSVITGDNIEVFPMMKKKFIQISCFSELGEILILVSVNN